MIQTIKYLIVLNYLPNTCTNSHPPHFSTYFPTLGFINFRTFLTVTCKKTFEYLGSLNGYLEKLQNIPSSTSSFLASTGTNNQVAGPSGASETDRHLHS